VAGGDRGLGGVELVVLVMVAGGDGELVACCWSRPRSSRGGRRSRAGPAARAGREQQRSRLHQIAATCGTRPA